jgi:enamine deaminase RidA (YjgF/YER057c/UK114 family)
MATHPSVRLVHAHELSDRAPYAYAAVAELPSRWVFTAGACPLDEHGDIIAAGDVAGQAEQVMANLRVALAAAGAKLTDVVKTTVYVATQRREDLLAAWDVVHRYFGDHQAPSTLLGVGVLGYPDQLGAGRGSGCQNQGDEPVRGLPHVRFDVVGAALGSGVLV